MFRSKQLNFSLILDSVREVYCRIGSIELTATSKLTRRAKSPTDPNAENCTVVTMAKHTRIVTHSRKDRQRNIIGVGGAFGYQPASAVIEELRANTHEYRVLRLDGPLVRPLGDQFLRSDPDTRTNNNLDDLPDC